MHNEELYNLFASPDIIGVIKYRRMRWAGHVARMGGMKNPYNIFGRDHSVAQGWNMELGTVYNILILLISPCGDRGIRIVPP
jgi:hypothetical protein